MKTFEKEFPEFELKVQIPEGFEDFSSRYDASPKWRKDLDHKTFIYLWINQNSYSIELVELNDVLEETVVEAYSEAKFNEALIRIASFERIFKSEQLIKRSKLYNHLSSIKNSFVELSKLWDQETDFLDQALTDDYPFGKSFDELTEDVKLWIERVNERIIML